MNAVLVAFNRTSMESKRDRDSFDAAWLAALLIEPVWNRNFGELHVDRVAMDF